jgi:predicted transposase YdaD
MISEQYGTVFTKEQYRDLCKVYSIWICPSPAQKRKNTISKYHMIKEDIYGRTDVLSINYDLMEVVIINLGDVEKESELEILNLLNVLFSPSMSSKKKKEILSNDFNIAMTQELESEVQNMCNLSDGIFELGRQEGERLGRQEGERLGRQQGEDNFASLIQRLLDFGRVDDVKRVANDKEYRNLLMKELEII